MEYEVRLREMDEKHQHELQELENTYQQKIMGEVERYQVIHIWNAWLEEYCSSVFSFSEPFLVGFSPSLHIVFARRWFKNEKCSKTDAMSSSKFSQQLMPGASICTLLESISCFFIYALFNLTCLSNEWRLQRLAKPKVPFYPAVTIMLQRISISPPRTLKNWKIIVWRSCSLHFQFHLTVVKPSQSIWSNCKKNDSFKTIVLRDASQIYRRANGGVRAEAQWGSPPSPPATWRKGRTWTGIFRDKATSGRRHWHWNRQPSVSPILLKARFRAVLCLFWYVADAMRLMYATLTQHIILVNDDAPTLPATCTIRCFFQDTLRRSVISRTGGDTSVQGGEWHNEQEIHGSYKGHRGPKGKSCGYGIQRRMGTLLHEFM